MKLLRVTQAAKNIRNAIAIGIPAFNIARIDRSSNGTATIALKSYASGARKGTVGYARSKEPIVTVESFEEVTEQFKSL